MENKKVLLGISGGVDSAVAAILLKKQGYEIIGAFMINYSDSKNPLTKECSYIEDQKDAIKVASKLNIPLHIFNYEKKYIKQVINPMFHSYSLGLTPNPDADCNNEIKFPMLRKEAIKLKCKYIATGHYIINRKIDDKQHLFRGKDKNKDQSYFLYKLKQKDLKNTLFPIGPYTKEEIRKIAEKNNLHNFNKRSSRGICFVGKTDMKSFLQKKIKKKIGNIINEKNEIIGSHPGINYFTTGERLKDSFTSIKNHHQKLYVAEKDIKNNTIKAVQENHPLLFKKEVIIEKPNWINKPTKNISVKIRHVSQPIPATLKKEKNRYVCIFKKAIDGLAEGQSIVIYNKEEVLGGGEIRFA